MANELPDYRDRQTINGPSITINPVPGFAVPDLHAAKEPAGAAQALSGLGAEITSVADKFRSGTQNTKSLQALSGFLDDRDGLTQKFVADTDFATAEDRFKAAIEAAKLGRLEDISDPEVRASAELQMKRGIIESVGKVRAAAALRQKETVDTSLDKIGKAARADAVNAPSPTAHAAAVSSYGDEVNRAVRSGWIDEPTAHALAGQFIVGVQTDKAKNAVAADPGRAIEAFHDDTMFPAVRGAARADLFNAAYRAEWMDDSDANGRAIADGAALLRNAGLTQDWLTAERDAMSPQWASAFDTALAAPLVATPDEALRARLLSSAVADPVSALQDSMHGLGAGTLAHDGYAGIADLSQLVMADHIARPWLNVVRRDLQAGLDDSDDPVIAGLRVKATLQFEQSISGQQDLSPRDAEIAAATLLDDFNAAAARHTIATLPMPRFAGASRANLDLPAVSGAAERLQAAMAAGQIDDMQFVEQAELLGSWRDALQRTNRADQ